MQLKCLRNELLLRRPDQLPSISSVFQPGGSEVEEGLSLGLESPQSKPNRGGGTDQSWRQNVAGANTTSKKLRYDRMLM